MSTESKNPLSARLRLPEVRGARRDRQPEIDTSGAERGRQELGTTEVLTDQIRSVIAEFDRLARAEELASRESEQLTESRSVIAEGGLDDGAVVKNDQERQAALSAQREKLRGEALRLVDESTLRIKEGFRSALENFSELDAFMPRRGESVHAQRAIEALVELFDSSATRDDFEMGYSALKVDTSGLESKDVLELKKYMLNAVSGNRGNLLRQHYRLRGLLAKHS